MSKLLPGLVDVSEKSEDLDDDAFLTLYFQTAPGRRPSLTALGSAFMEFDRFAGGVLARSDALSNVEIVFDRSESGSLRIVTKAIGSIKKSHLEFLASVIVVSLLVQPLTGIVTEDFWRRVLEQIGYDPRTLSDEDVRAIGAEVKRLQEEDDLKRAKRSFYQTLEDDDAIKGFSALPSDPPGPPDLIIPRSMFSSVAPPISKEDEQAKERKVLSRMPLTLLRPVLKLDSKSSWGFVSGQQHISAKVEDAEFRRKVLKQELNVPLAEGVTLDANVEVTQRYVDGVWENIAYSVKRVHSWRPPENQPSLIPEERD
ncbi:hypothetical protein ACRARG_12685 [Pseudooceanicola sp. C21-150M6]|uniref:hypothetical protein n=1 Tax=Pseudooceanicola sp. C21-150M6 TaxID=3434355 RepID=UPI003D7FFEAD